ncbi:IspD/TarI family cytidylyltransferase [Thermophilibacter immobilis]|uniref:2-C-methyl-D-erythritol 4-phosphate cytidylyltransferase n=1 Tax=Thermophilibacter immobilis TaxID=2779519 RepID=A0A7S7RU71_9ACTN|nr:2-C-methyl-D-erythritol 4-phosphate cytidylyltransferase [Thermophilibacter immobilis]
MGHSWGGTGQESILLGLKEIARHSSPDDAVIIHDGIRPMVSAEVISDGLATYRERGCSVEAIPCVEAIFRCADGVSSTESLPREELWRTRAPPIWPLGRLLWARDEAARRGKLTRRRRARSCRSSDRRFSSCAARRRT